MDQLEAARAAATADAAAAGIAAEDVGRAVEYGRAGAHWAARPAHRYLGRIAQLTDEMSARLDESADYRQRVAELERRLAQSAPGED
ncbi:hypothetical protein [Nocardia sp. CY41]|uniref:hypothetical protein n=1 Tax=Nocardia sp. CY41 TaxID=2608686 RepID=UPI001358E6FD|nr:hypothetical protein [Nocardia sp. CY41]